MPQIHLRAEPGDYAPLVLLPGDPGRATMIAGLFDGGLENARLVNQHRSLLGYTGTYKGKPVSVQTSGMGTPSFSIVMEELLMLGVTRFIRTGTCGGIGPRPENRRHGRRHGRGAGRWRDADLPARRSVRSGGRLRADPRAGRHGARQAASSRRSGVVQSVDVFYNTDSDYASKMRSRGVVAVEMEAAALFYLAMREQGSGKDVRGRVHPDRQRHAR